MGAVFGIFTAAQVSFNENQKCLQNFLCLIVVAPIELTLKKDLTLINIENMGQTGGLSLNLTERERAYDSSRSLI